MCSHVLPSNWQHRLIAYNKILTSIHFLLIFIFTARVAKRAKAMFSQACVTHSIQPGGGVGNTKGLPPPPQVNTLPPGQHLPPPRTRSQHLPPPPPDKHLPPPPGTRSQHLPSPGQHLPPPPWDQVTTPPSPSLDNTSLPPPGQHLLPLWDQVTTLHSPLDNTSPWLGSKVTTPPLGQHLPPLPWLGSKVTTPPPPPGLCAGGRYASYWNAFLFTDLMNRFRC